MPDGSSHISTEGASQLNQALVHFSYLQVLDFLSTIAFLVNGIKEANPLGAFGVEVQAPARLAD